MNYAVVVSRYNQNITDNLLRGALDTFKRHKVKPETVQTFWVPGAFEIPQAAMKLAKSKKFQAIVCLGCVLKGETDHNRFISEATASAIMRIGLETGVVTTFGVLTPNDMKQAVARSGKNSANKGMEAAEAAVEMVELFQGMKHGK